MTTIVSQVPPADSSFGGIISRQRRLLADASSQPAVHTACQAAYRVLLGLHSEKGGNIASLFHWQKLNRTLGRTVWRQDMVFLV